MRDDDLKIIDEFLNVCKVVHPYFKNSGTVMAVYKRSSFDHSMGKRRKTTNENY